MRRKTDENLRRWLRLSTFEDQQGQPGTGFGSEFGWARVANFADYSEHVLIRLHRQLRATGDQTIRDLIRECLTYPGVSRPQGATHAIAPVLALRLAAGDTVLSFFTVVSTLGAPYDVTLDEIVIESFFPADAATARAIGMHASHEM